jgi:hypothetical protein
MKKDNIVGYHIVFVLSNSDLTGKNILSHSSFGSTFIQKRDENQNFAS